MATRGQLQDSSNIKQRTTKHQSDLASQLLSRIVAENSTEKSPGLERADDVGFERSELLPLGRGEPEAVLKRGKRQCASDERGVIPEHGGTHGCGTGESVDAPVAHSRGGRVGGVIFCCEEALHDSVRRRPW